MNDAIVLPEPEPAPLRPPHPVLLPITALLVKGGREGLSFGPEAAPGIRAALLIAGALGDFDHATADVLRFATYLEGRGARSASAVLRDEARNAGEVFRARNVGDGIRASERSERQRLRFAAFTGERGQRKQPTMPPPPLAKGRGRRPGW